MEPIEAWYDPTTKTFYMRRDAAPRGAQLHPYTEAEFLNLPTCELAIAGINAVAAEARALRDENKGLMQRLAKLRKTENPH